MNIKSMDDDLFRRICRKQCIPAESEAEIEIFDAESSEHVEEEAVEEYEEPFDLQAWTEELECMKRRIQFLQLKLKTKMDKCPEKECVDFELELTCSENKEICALQKNQFRLQSQINELIRCCRFAKDQIKDLRAGMCQKSKDIYQLQKMVDMLDSWRKTLEHEFGVCIERFEYLKHVKAEWADVLAEIEKQKKCYAKLEEMFVPKACFLRDKQLFVNECDTLRDLFKNLCLLQIDRYTTLERRVSSIEAQLPEQEEQGWESMGETNNGEEEELKLINNGKIIKVNKIPTAQIPTYYCKRDSRRSVID